MNTFSFTGNLGKDCRTGNAGGTDVCNFTVAVKSGYGERQKTEWVDVAYWGNGGQAVAPYLLKGKQVAVAGELSLTEATGEFPAKLSVRATSVTLLGTKEQGGQQQPATQQRPQQSGGWGR